MRNIVLVGFMGTGKSAVGRMLSSRFIMTHIDMDQVIVRRQGRSIARIFDEEGESYFRDLERALVSELSEQHDLVISTGGGIVLNPENIRDFERTGDVICLDASPDTILERVKSDTERPLLQGESPAAAIAGILEERRDLYDSVRLHVETDNRTLKEVVEAVCLLVGRGNPAG